jgi:hypothetical protein
VVQGVLLEKLAGSTVIRMKQGRKRIERKQRKMPQILA